MRDGFKPELCFSNADSLRNWLMLTVRGRIMLKSVIPEWLTYTDTGRLLFDRALLDRTAISEDALRAEVERRLARRAPCLIVCHADGLIEAYGDQVTVHFADVLDMQGVDPVDDGDHATTEAEHYMEANLPPKFRRLFTQRSTIHYYDPRTPEQEQFRRLQLTCFHAMPGWKQQEAERLHREAIRRERLARKKYPEPLAAPF